MREAGRVVAEALDQVRRMAGAGRHDRRPRRGGRGDLPRARRDLPLFRGYPSSVKGKPPFPAVICTSVNEQVVHGIPNRRPLREGDIVSIDTGCKLNGWCGDAAVTLPIGAVRPEVQKLLDVTSRDARPGHPRDGAAAGTGREVAGLMEQYVKSQGLLRRREVRRPRHRPGHARGAAGAQLRQQGPPQARHPARAGHGPGGRADGRTWGPRTSGPSTTTGPSRPRTAAPSAHFEHTVAMTPDGPRVLTCLED